MSKIDVRVVLVPSLLTREDVEGRTVIGFDVLRATTTIAAALAMGVEEVVLHPTLDAARDAYSREMRERLLVGEQSCLKPEDFDLGNSPGSFRADHAGRVVHMATTNGTKALLAPFSLGTPRAVLAGALVNRLAIAKACVEIGAGVTLLCAGTDGAVAYEDSLACGAVIESLVNLQAMGKADDSALLVMGAWTFAVAGIVRAKPDQPAYPAGFRLARGAVNVIDAGLPEDVVFAARPDVFDVVGIVESGYVRKR